VQAAALYLLDLRILTRVGSGYVAMQMCSCIFVSRRSFDSCRSDMLESMTRIDAPVVSDAGRSGVRASIRGLSERVAIFSEGHGCTLE